MATWRVRSGACSVWEASTSYTAGDRVVSTYEANVTQESKVYRCSVGGISNDSEPDWNTTISNTTEDNEVTWVTESPADGTWDNATCNLRRIMQGSGGYYGGAAGGDTILVADDHDEEYSGNTDLKGGDETDIVYILCVDVSDDSLSSGATVYVTGTVTFVDSVYSYGVKYKCTNLYMSGDNFWTLSGGTVIQLIGSGRIYNKYGKETTVRIVDGNIQMDTSGGYIANYASKTSLTTFIWENGTLIAPSGCATLFDPYHAGFPAIVRNVDLSQCGDGSNKRSLVRGDRIFNKIIFDRCKLPDPAVATGFTVVGPSDAYPALDFPSRVELYQCSHTNVRSDVHIEDCFGTITTDLDVYCDGGADDGLTSFSLKMVRNSETGVGPFFVNKELNTTPICGWTDSTSETTFTVEGVLDSAVNLQDDELWMELDYPVNNTDGLGGRATSRVALPLDSPSDLSSSSGTWTGTGGFSNENKFKLSVTVTPGRAGPITTKIFLAKPSTTVYIDPIVTET